MCGAEVEKLYRTLIEGTELMVCHKCSRFGVVKAVVESRSLVEKHKKRLIRKSGRDKETTEQQAVEIDFIIPDYATRVKKAREKKALKQESLAKAIAEKESVIHNIESGRLEPSIELARKLERFLGIKLVEKISDNKQNYKKLSSKTLTIGDVLKR